MLKKEKNKKKMQIVNKKFYSEWDEFNSYENTNAEIMQREREYKENVEFCRLIAKKKRMWRDLMDNSNKKIKLIDDNQENKEDNRKLFCKKIGEIKEEQVSKFFKEYLFYYSCKEQYNFQGEVNTEHNYGGFTVIDCKNEPSRLEFRVSFRDCGTFQKLFLKESKKVFERVECFENGTYKKLQIKEVSVKEEERGKRQLWPTFRIDNPPPSISIIEYFRMNGIVYKVHHKVLLVIKGRTLFIANKEEDNEKAEKMTQFYN